MKQIVVDIETLNWFDQPHIKDLPRELQVAAMGYGVGVTWDNGDVPSHWWDGTPSETVEDIDRFEVWDNSDITLLWDYLTQQADVIMGWNIIAFDLPIIARAAGVTIGERKFPQVFDLFDIIKQITGRWYKLDVVAQANLGRGKTGEGKQAAKWLVEGEIYKAAEYCRVDVELERDLCLMAIAGKTIRLPALEKWGQNTPMTLSLDWERKDYTLTGKY